MDSRSMRESAIASRAAINAMSEAAIPRAAYRRSAISVIALNFWIRVSVVWPANDRLLPENAAFRKYSFGILSVGMYAPVAAILVLSMKSLYVKNQPAALAPEFFVSVRLASSVSFNDRMKVNTRR